MQFKFWKLILMLIATFVATSSFAQENRDYRLAAGDTIHIVVFQNPDLTLDTRVSEDGSVTYPLIGSLQIGGLTIADAEQKIAHALQAGGYVKGPQVNINIVQIIGNQVAVLGFVGRPGSYPLPTFTTHLTQLIATAGGILPGLSGGSNEIILSGTRDGKPFNRKIDIASIYLDDKPDEDIILSGGDSIFVPKAPIFYIYGQVNRPGQYVVERQMTVMEALATGGGPTLRGSERRIRLNRRNPDGTVAVLSPELSDPVLPDDVLYVNESFF